MSNTTEPPVQKKHLPSFLEPQPAPSAGVLPSFGFRNAVTPCLTGVLEFKFIKDASCDSDGAQELCLDHKKGRIPPLITKSQKKKSPEHLT